MFNIEIKDATKTLAVARALNSYMPPFKVIDNYRLIDNGIEPEATVQIEADGKYIHEAANGTGPVDALAGVLKKALIPLFPFLEKIFLIDYHAEIIDARLGTATAVMVSITFSNGEDVWKVYTASENINRASFHVLVDGLEFAILNQWQKDKTKN